MKRKSIFIAFIFILMLFELTYSTTYYVDDARPDDNGTGLSWEEAKKTISAAISVSAAGDIILVKYGIYLITESISVASNRMITSDDGTNDSWEMAFYDSSQCIIMADTLVDSCRVFTINTGNVTNSTHVRGFKITYGNAAFETIKPLYGGGILITDEADPVIENCWISQNKAATINDLSYGGGIAITGAGTDPVIQYCAIDSNIASISNKGYGGGISTDDISIPLIHHNTIAYNKATTYGPGYGGGIYCNNSYATISYNVISHNIAVEGSSSGRGGGIYGTSGIVQILSNEISYNTASTSRGGDGGGIYITSSSGTHRVRENEISDNIGSTNENGDGGGIYCSGEVDIRNNVIKNNIACTSGSSQKLGYGGGVCIESYGPILEYNIIDNNTASLYGVGRGGGIRLGGQSVSYNIISNNVASVLDDGYGGGVWAYNAANIVLSNNTFYGNANTEAVFASGSGSGLYYWYGAYNFDMKNNIFLNHNLPGSDSVAVFSDESLTIRNNCFYNNGIDYNANITSNNEVLANPQLTDPAGGDFHLLYNSPCIDAGADTLVYDETENHDMGWVVDIGADEYTGTRVWKSIYGAGEYYFGGQVRAKINVTTPGSLSEIDFTVHPGETHANAPSSVQRWYKTTATGSGATFDVTLSYKDVELNGENEDYLNLWRWDSANWYGPGLSSDSSMVENWLTVTGQTSFSDWVIADADSVGALPVKDKSIAISNYELLQNYPNPFNPETTIEFVLPHNGFVTLKIYNILGVEVETLVSDKLPAGKYTYNWNADGLASGVYFFRINFKEYSLIKKALLLK